MNHSQPPIGYVLKQLDQALTAYTDKALGKHQLTRLHWQILNVVKDGGNKDFQQIMTIMKPFLDEPQLTTLLTDLEGRGWIVQGDEAYKLTTAGEDGLRLASQTQGDVRKQLIQGVSQEEYASTISTLQKMLENVS